MSKLLYKSNEWTVEALEKTWEKIKQVNNKYYKLDLFPTRYEIISYESMIDLHCSHGLPGIYRHWSFGRDYIKEYSFYKNVSTNLAYELAINSNPCLMYLLENSSMTMQATVMAHAGVGHNNFFKVNNMFTEHTNAKLTLSLFNATREYVQECEEKYGRSEVTSLIDACHALKFYGIDRRIKTKKTRKERLKAIKEIKRYRNSQYNPVFDDTIEKPKKPARNNGTRLNEENILKTLAEVSPTLKPWERRLVLLLCQVNQYLYPIIMTKMMNEGWASFWHYTIMNKLGDLGHISEANVIEFLRAHTQVIYQPEFDHPGYSGINPYKLGFEMFQDIRRICEDPTSEDKEFFPDIAGQPWLPTLKWAAENFKDSSFISQYLSPHLIRKLKLFSFQDDSEKQYYEVTDIHDDEGYKNICRNLSEQYTYEYMFPDIRITRVSTGFRRSLQLTYRSQNERDTDARQTRKVLKHLKRLWPFPIELKWCIGDDILYMDETLATVLRHPNV